MNGAWTCKCRHVLNPELQVVLAPIEHRYARSEKKPETAFLFIVTGIPEPHTGPGFEICLTANTGAPVLQSQSISSRVVT